MLMPLAMMTNTPPIFSIITITLNNLTGLKKTHKSITAQNSSNYEWIVIDGASSDESINYLKSADANWISEPDQGLYDAMNKGIALATGQYLIFMNAGDCFATINTLTIIQDQIKSQSPDFIYGDAQELFNNTLIYKKSRSHHKITQGMFTHHQAMIYSRDLINNQKYDLNYLIAADYDLTLRLLAKAESTLYIAAPICLFESGGISEQNAIQGRKEQFIIRRNFGISIFKNTALFIAQSILYQIRRFCPKLYWFLKHY